MRTASVFAAALLLAGCGKAAALAPPAPDTRGAEPPVASAIQRARERVLARARDAEAWSELALVCDAHGFRAEARACYARASELEPREFLWPYLASACVAEDDLEAALAWLERARELRADDPWIELRRGEILCELGARDAARLAFEAALASAPATVDARIGLARLALEAGEPLQARSLLEGAPTSAEENRTALVLLARALELAGDQQAARATGERALALPDPPPRKDPYRERVEARGVSSLHLAIRGQQELRAGRLEQAIASFQAALASRPDLEPAQIELAQALVLSGRCEDGLATLRQIVQLSPDNLAASRSLAAALAACGDLDASAELCRQLLERVPEDRALLENYAQLLRQLGREEEALAAERRFAGGAPGDHGD